MYTRMQGSYDEFMPEQVARAVSGWLQTSSDSTDVAIEVHAVTLLASFSHMIRLIRPRCL